MNVTLIHNPKAGEGDREAHELLGKLRRRGDDVALISARSKEIEELAHVESDLVVAAGGDGTVAAVVRSVGPHTPILIAPIGTANNIAQSIGIKKVELDLKTVMSRWRRKALDVARIGDEIVVESAGCGAIAGFMRLEPDEDRDGVRHEAKTLADRLESSPHFDYRVVVDGEQWCGEALLLEVMNIRQMGPNVRLAPDADPGDGLLELVTVSEADRAAFCRYLRAPGQRRLPVLPTRRGRSFSIACDAPWHHDDEPRGRHERTIVVMPGAWTAMTPPNTA